MRTLNFIITMRNNIFNRLRNVLNPVVQLALQARDWLNQFFYLRLMARTFRELGEDEVSQRAASLAYYAILSVFPLILGLVAILGIFLPSENVQEELLAFFERNLPGAAEILEANIPEIISHRGTIGAISLILLLWSSSFFFGSMRQTLNRIWGLREYGPYYRRKFGEIMMSLGVGVLFLLSIASTSAFSILEGLDNPVVSTAYDIGARLFGFVTSIVILLVLYKFVPNTKTRWKFVWPGALAAGIVFEIAKTIFIFYLQNFARYESIYGSVGSVIVFLLWVYISAFTLILGAEISSEYGKMRGEESLISN
ncbi:MAG: YihY/virulence factor BrkB family protein [Dehalococcoidia bacterium]|nr:MAG: YihY/virulence factor BrkB family protein [Dehalococcoidia bacterium]